MYCPAAAGAVCSYLKELVSVTELNYSKRYYAPRQFKYKVDKGGACAYPHTSHFRAAP